MRRSFGVLLTALVLFSLGACTHSESSARSTAPERATVAVSTPRLDALVRRLVPDAVDLVVISPAGTDARMTIPDRYTMRDLVRAQCIVLHGLGYETWEHAVSLPEQWTLRLGALDGVTAIIERTETHQHGVDGMHTHDVPAPGAELDPVALTTMIDGLAARLADLSGVDATAVETARAACAAELAEIDDTLRALAPGAVTTHGVPYLARRYDWAHATDDGVPHVAIDGRVLEVDLEADPVTVLRAVAAHASAG